MALKEKLLEANLLPWTSKNRPLFVLSVAALVFLGMLPLIVVPSVGSGEKWPYLFLLLMPIGFAILFARVYLGVGRRMDKVRASVQDGATLQADCLMVRNMIECPAIAQILDGDLVLTPLIGKPVQIEVEKYRVKVVAGRFNGTVYPGQTAFWLEGPEVSWRLGFAVPKGEIWRRHLLGDTPDSESAEA